MLQLTSLPLKLESVEENEQHYRSIAQEYKVEREHFRSLSDSLQSKLSERNASIEKIEQEVQKVEMQFQQKIAAIEISHKHELESLMTKTQVSFSSFSFNLFTFTNHSFYRLIAKKQNITAKKKSH